MEQPKTLQIGSQVSLETWSFGAKNKELKGIGIWEGETEKAIEAEEALRGPFLNHL